MKGNFLSFIYKFFFHKYSISQIPNIENREKKKIKADILNTYYRSKNKWIFHLRSLENKSGAACIQWPLMSEVFSNGIFDALGYSQNILSKSIRNCCSFRVVTR